VYYIHATPFSIIMFYSGLQAKFSLQGTNIFRKSVYKPKIKSNLYA